MSHMVIFRTPEGKPGYQPADTVQDAVAVVERLRNDEGVENVRIFRLEELSFEYRPYYKVEIAGVSSDDDAEGSAAAAIDGGSEPEAAPVSDAFAEPAGDTEVVGAADGAIDVGHNEVEADVEANADESSAEPVTASAEHPPWAAPPPPPPAPPVGGVFGAESNEGESNGNESDDELSGSGHRRGLFGR